MTEPADLPTLLEISDEIAWPDTDAEAETRARLIAGGLGERTFGRLGDLAIWLSGVQGVCPPQEPRRPRLVLFVDRPRDAADPHAAGTGAAETPAAGTGAAETRDTDTHDAGTHDTHDAGTHGAGSDDANAVSLLFADVAGLGVRIVEVDPGPASDPGADRLSAEVVDAAIRAGAKAADDEIDAGADLFVAATDGDGGPSVDAIVSTMTLTEPVKVVGLDTVMSDAAWMTWVATVRDDRLRAMPHRHEVTALLAAVGTTQLAAVTGFLLRAAARRTPVLLDGDVVAAATLLAREVTPNVVRWWQPGARSSSPAQALAMEEFGAVAVLDLKLGLGAGVGGALAVPLLRAAARAVAELTVPAPTPPPATEVGDPDEADPDVAGDDVPASDVPAGGAPADDAPAGDAPVGSAPAADAPVGSAPAANAPVENAP